jgi:ADP-heptose:LPS heptosyltransferase/GT2 family glycosyltransferase
MRMPAGRRRSQEGFRNPSEGRRDAGALNGRRSAVAAAENRLASLAAFSSGERFSVPDQPKSILYIRPDTIGDLVIFSSALNQLLAAWPDARHILLVRPGYEALAPLFPPALIWKTVAINPFSQKPSEARELLASTLAELRDVQPDMVVAATLNRTWLEVAIAAHFPHARRISLGRSEVDPLFANLLKLDYGVDAASAFSETVAIEECDLDWSNNHRLVEHLLGAATARRLPTISVPETAHREAAATLAELGVGSSPFGAVFVGGLANVPIKAWPEEHFGAVITWLQRAQGITPLLMAHESEADWVRRVAAAAVRAGATEPRVWLGRGRELALLAGMLQRARLYVGHDTGAMHIAAAVGTPVVAIFGGGHWPRFRPVGRQTISVVEPLPCFGCGWDCRFGNAPCVKVITPADVQAALDRVIPAGGAEFNEVLETRNVSAQARDFIAAVSPRYAQLQADRLERQHRIEGLKREADTKDSEIASLKRETNGKDAEIASLKAAANTKDSEIRSLKTAADVKDDEIAALKSAAEARKAEMESIKAELEDECAQKDREIAGLKAEANTKDAEIAGLKDVCNQREQLIIQQDQHIKNFQATVAQLQKDVADKDRHIANLDTEMRRLSGILAKLPADAEQWSKIFHDQNVHIQNIENILAARDREIAALRDSNNNYAAGYGALEQVKYYGKLLAEKETVIQNLHRACVEREAVIKQLALDVAGPLGRMNKFWYATKKHWELKYWVPFNDWLFKKVVEDYWMQIGILQHYEPRPLKWDKFPKPSLPENKLPKIGIVTPSYGQATFIESTILSVLNQKYPKLHYVVQDGGSKDASPQIIAKYADRLHHWESVKDKGQADAIRKGFTHLDGALGPNDLMAWLNSDDFVAPRALRFVAEYFARHPDVDVVYGHRIIINGEDREVGRWIMPKHDPKTLEWIDYVPQETLFWRKRIWDRVGGIDPSFQFALDWDLLARFQQANAKVVRLPYFLGCFRIHREQKTSQQIHTVGNEEMIKIRSRFHGDRHSDFETINRFARKARFTGALTARLAALGIRY